MADDKKRNTTDERDPRSMNEIDDFTQKLLDKKVELSLFPDDDDITSQSLEGSISEAQRKTAESSMLNALDQLRKERGQSTIEEEEESYRRQHGYEEEPEEEKPAPSKESSSQKREDDLFLFTDPNRYETVKREDHFEKAEKRPDSPKPANRSRLWLIGALVLVVALLFGGYVWKTMVYDPAHVSDQSQEEAYARLVNFADEYNMMSETQKKDIIKLEEDYNSLPEAKKKDINEYFQNPKHTGQTFTDLLAAARQNSLLEANPALGELLSYAQSYPGLGQAEKDDIVNRLDAFNSLTDEAKAQVDQAFQTAVEKDFMSVYNETRARLDEQNAQAASQQQAQEQPEQEPAAQPSDDGESADAESLQAQLTQLQIDRDNYVYFLESEGLPLQGDAVLAEYDAQIASIQAQLGL